ncbi:MAG: hypothetical protein Q9174_002962 [Haloplaca sp. 1 TL-2023]
MMIYPYLLIARTRRHYGWVRNKFGVMTEILNPPTASDSIVVGAVGGRVVDPINIQFLMMRGEPYCGQDEALHPQMLSTCRIIRQEATSILYTENAFRFWTPYFDLDETPEDDLTPQTEEACRNLMSFDVDDWQSEVPGKAPPSPVASSSLAAFLLKIGPINANTIRSLHLTSPNADRAALDTKLLTWLSLHHLHGLKDFTLGVDEKEDIWPNESPEWWHPDHSSPFWTNGEFDPLYDALEAFIDTIEWLETFTYDRLGQMDFQVFGQYGLFLGLEDVVKARTEERKELANEIRDEMSSIPFMRDRFDQVTLEDS